jgi:hypothetical protein
MTHSDQDLEAFIDELDTLIFKYQDRFEAHNITGMLLSRITLLMTMDPALGKELLKYVWTQLDEIEQADPGSMIP